MKRFVLLGDARTGSSMLASSLAAHSEIAMYGEILNPDPTLRRAFSEQMGNPYLNDHDDGAHFLANQIYSPARTEAAVGFKLHIWHGRSREHSSAWKYLCKDRGIGIISLWRENLLETLVSDELTKRGVSPVVWVGRDERPRQVAPFLLAPKHCENFFWRRHAFNKLSRTMFKHHVVFDVEYSNDLCKNFHTTLSRIWSWLGVAQAKPEVFTEKLAGRPVEEQVLNYAELRAYFSGTPHARYFG